MRVADQPEWAYSQELFLGRNDYFDDLVRVVDLGERLFQKLRLKLLS